jgi:hypothetical protein
VALRGFCNSTAENPFLIPSHVKLKEKSKKGFLTGNCTMANNKELSIMADNFPTIKIAAVHHHGATARWSAAVEPERYESCYLQRIAKNSRPAISVVLKLQFNNDILQNKM